MQPCDLAPLVEQLEYSSRLEFLYKAVEDTQNTIRFIDTKAAFCVTLLSGMAAGAIEAGRSPSAAHRTLFAAFLLAAGATLLICLRVIFPTVKPHKTHMDAPGRPAPPPRGPKFFIGHNKRQHWVLHTLRNAVDDDVLNESHASYFAAFAASKDQELLSSMCEEVVMISLIRQIKSDRLHAAMFSLVGAVVVFVCLMLS